MAAGNFLVSPRQFGKYSEDDLADSPPRPTMGAIDHFNQDQFGSVLPAREKDLGYDAEADNQSFMNDLASKQRQ